MKPLAHLPGLAVELNGGMLPVEAVRTLGAVRVQQRLSLPAQCELAFLDPDPVLLEDAAFSTGATIKLLVAGRGPALFEGLVTAVEYRYGPSRRREMRVRAYDRLYQLRKRQPVTSHVQLTVEELASDLVSDLGILVDASESGPVLDKLAQTWESDLEMLASTAERCGLYFSLRGDLLHLMTLSGVGQPLPLVLGDSLIEASVDVNVDPVCRRVATFAWDPWEAGEIYGEASEPRSGRRTEAAAGAGSLSVDTDRTLVDELAQSTEQASAFAQGELDRRSAAEVRFRGVADGDPALQPGAIVEVDGMARPISGRYVLSSVNHTIDRERGFTSELDTLPPRTMMPKRGTISTLGNVADVADPEELGRVKVSLPTFGDFETDWFEVVCPGAGVGKGIVALPDVDDQVLVLLSRENPAQGVVIGGLFGSEGPPDSGVEGGAIKRYTFRTPGGQRMRLDDEKNAVKLVNSAGHSVKLSPGRVRLEHSQGSFMELTKNKLQIHAESDLEIEAPGHAITITAQSIDLKRG